MTPTRMTLVDLLEARLRAAGEDRPQIDSRPQVKVGPPAAELTDREHAVAAMVGQALSNKQIAKRMLISPHTVNYHLRQIYRKLDINSRLQLAQRLHTPV